MASEQKKGLSSPNYNRADKLLIDIFENLSSRTRENIASLRIALVGQDKATLKEVQSYISDSLSPIIMNEANARIAGGISDDLWKAVENSVTVSLNRMIANQNPEEIKEFYQDITVYFVGICKNFQSAEEFIVQKGRWVRRAVARIMPDFWSVDRLEKFNIFWNKEIQFARKECLDGPAARREREWLGRIITAVTVIFAIAFAFSPSWKHIVAMLISYIVVFIGHTIIATFRMGSFHWGTNADAKALAYIAKEEQALSCIVQRGYSLNYEFAQLPSLAEMRKRSAVSTPVAGGSTAETKRVLGTFDNRRDWTNVDLSAQSSPTALPPAALPVVDLSKELGSSACYKENEEKNTLFQFGAPDTRYVFVSPIVEREMKPGSKHLEKFMKVARHARLVAKHNEQGIKSLGRTIKDPVTGKGYDAVELKILGSQGAGETRLLGALIPIYQSGKQYNVYVFNTVWDKKDLPESFSASLTENRVATVSPNSIGNSPDRFIGGSRSSGGGETDANYTSYRKIH